MPQGSILGPLLFLIYINDLPSCTNLFLLLFADDTTVLASGKNIDELVLVVNNEFKKICNYSATNKLALNPLKTKVMVFSGDAAVRNRVIEIKMEDLKGGSVVLEQLRDKPIRFLGVSIDSQLNYKSHIQIIQKKLSTALYFMRNSRNVLTEKAIKFLYYSLFHSNLVYAIQLWSTASATLIDGLFKMQKKAVRLITESVYNAHTEPLFKKTGILPLPSLIQFFKLQFMQQYFQKFLPKSFDSTWVSQEERRNLEGIPRRYEIRNDGELFIPPCRLTCLERHPYFCFPRV